MQLSTLMDSKWMKGGFLRSSVILEKYLSELILIICDHGPQNQSERSIFQNFDLYII